MGKPYKQEVTMQYTTVMYYDEDGNVVAEERQNDDHSWEASPRLHVTEGELEDYYA